MILHYGISIAGRSHVRKGIGCQDYNGISSPRDGIVVAAIADGVGSCKHADIGSKVAVETALESCLDAFRADRSAEISTDILLKAFAEANNAILELSARKGDQPSDYDTTLSMAIYDGERIVFGHSGDGGIIGLLNEGEYVKITRPQKGEDGISVVPLRWGKDHWEFGTAHGPFAGVVLVTDGILDTFTPCLLIGQKNDLHISLIRYFVDNNILKATPENIDRISQSRRDFLCSDACNAITDDMTVVVLLNGAIAPKMREESYYREPDWEKLQAEFMKKLYPGRYDGAEPSPRAEGHDLPVTGSQEKSA